MTISRLVLATAVAVPSGAVGLAAPVVADIAAHPVAAEGVTMSAGRLGSTVAALLGLAGVIIGGLALARPRTGETRRGAIALAAGIAALALGALVVVTSDSGIGTGNGRGGGYVALVVGLIAVVVGVVAVARSRRAG
ncbi:DUF6223 family protein [Micromonospora andamanensis]|uniref:Major facilitator superfamily (MFS) profile domain-containing protein n=1 Tax=Micromonospora andamanensis TaxID=1287068 RepID=A0ABQ4I0X9_9ACTN|nr:DUF6223 family protein [Micromonospora andamanensis]GIJ11516.1 hypothetical protein Van01_47300 [Micromonospora andamanensis]